MNRREVRRHIKASWTPERRAAHAAKISAAWKRGSRTKDEVAVGTSATSKEQSDEDTQRPTEE